MRQLPTGTITLLFTDIEGSTRLLQQLGKAYADVLKECRRLLREAFQQENGFEVDTQGDAFFVVFERALDAVTAAVKAQRVLFAAHWPDEVAVRVRIGIHTGEPQPTEEGYIGLDVHLAARIMSAGHGGQVLLSQATRDLVVDDLHEEVSLRDLGTFRLKDIVGLNELFQLVVAGLPAAFPPLATLPSRHTMQNMPAPSTSFVGREREVKAINTLLRRPDVRLLTLFGPAGVGKTRLALYVAAQLSTLFPDGMCFVALDQANDADSVLTTLAQVLTLQEEKERPLFEQIKAVLRELSFLLVLDNFEQVMSARQVIADLLATCPKLKVLVTSRVMLHMQAEHVFEVHPLPLPDLAHLSDSATLSSCASIVLFVQRAQAVQPAFQLTSANAAAVAGICVRLDGIPLAIELAAARSRHFQPAALLKHMERGLSVLQGRADDVPGLPRRQQTLEGAVAWSYNLLTAAEQRVFRRFAVCVNGATLEAAEHICAEAADVIGLLEALVDKSMLQRQAQEEGEVRFWQLQTLREYAEECLREEGEQEAAQAAHATYYLSWVEQVVPLLSGAENIRWLDRLDTEYENVVAALDWLLEHASMEALRAEQALRLCVALLVYWETRGYFSDGLAFLERALAQSARVGDPTKEGDSIGASSSSDTTPGIVSGEQNIVPALHPASMQAERAQALHGAAFLALMQDDYTRAEAFLRESQMLFRESGDRAGMANILRLQGSLALARCNYKVARRLLEEARAIYQERGDSQWIRSTQWALAQVAIAQCDYPRARSLLTEQIASSRARQERYRTALPLYLLALTHFLSRDDLAASRTIAQESLALFKEVGNRRLMGYVLLLLGQILLVEGQEGNDKARELLEESLALLKATSDRAGTADALMALARAAVAQSEYTLARTYYEQSWTLLRTSSEKSLIATCLEGLGEVLVPLAASGRAAQLWGTAATLRATMLAPMPPVYRTSYIQAVSLARELLGEEAFHASWMQGHDTPLDQLTLTQE